MCVCVCVDLGSGRAGRVLCLRGSVFVPKKSLMGQRTRVCTGGDGLTNKGRTRRVSGSGGALTRLGASALRGWRRSRGSLSASCVRRGEASVYVSAVL